MADPDLDSVIEENAEGPAEVTGDSGSVKQHSLADQIAADRYLNSKAAARSESRGIMLTKLKAGGGTS